MQAEIAADSGSVRQLGARKIELRLPSFALYRRVEALDHVLDHFLRIDFRVF